MTDEVYANIREMLGGFIGRPVLDITQHDREYFDSTGRSFIDLMFDDGDVLRFYVQDHGLVINPSDDGDPEFIADER